MDTVFRIVKVTDEETQEVTYDKDVLYIGTPDKVENWLRTAAAAPTAQYVSVEGDEEPLTIEEYYQKHNTK